MGYLIFTIVLAAILISIVYLRTRPTRDPVKSVQSFQTAIKALDPNRKAKVRAQKTSNG